MGALFIGKTGSHILLYCETLLQVLPGVYIYIYIYIYIYCKKKRFYWIPLFHYTTVVLHVWDWQSQKCNSNCLPSRCEQSWNMVKHVCINVNHSIIWWLTIWKPCHRHDITMEYRSIVRLNETSCRSWYHLITWYHGPTWHHLYMYKYG